ncbi:MAG: glycosyltransferase [Candidatus Gallimonas sp.]
MIKVCFVVNALLFGGVEKVIENYLKGFDKNTFSFTIIAQEGSSIENIAYFESMGFKVELVTHKRKNWIKNAKQIKELLKAGNYDIVHSHMSFTNFYVLRIAKKLGIKTRINHYHNVFQFAGLKSFFVRVCNKLCDRYATCNIFCSREVKKYFGKSTKESFILYNAIDIDRFEYSEENRAEVRKKFEIGDNTTVVGHVGRFVEQKNHSFLLELFHEYHKRNSNSKLMLCGEGPMMNSIQEKADALNILSDVIFVGSTTEISKFYQAMDVFVFPSLYEGLGLTFLEAQISGLFCIGSDILADEAIVSDSVKRLSLKEPIGSWVKEFPLSNKNSHNGKFNDRIDMYNLDKCRSKLLDYYKKEVTGTVHGTSNINKK